MKMQFNSNRAQKTESKSGFGIMEVLIAMALLFMLSLGMTSLFTNMQNEQKRQNLIAFLTTKRGQILTALQNEQSWKNTLAQAASMACLRNNTVCDAYFDATANTYEVSQASFKIFDGGGVADPANVIVHGTIPGDITSSGLNGFTDTGVPCSTFTTLPAGNDACPIAYRVSWVAEATGVGPRILIYVKMIYNPTDINSLKTFFNAGPAATTINEKYDVKYSRTASTANRSFSFGSKLTGINTGAGCGDHGYGVCDGSNYDDLEDISDPFELVSYNGGLDDQVIFNAIGRYSCTFTTYAFMANNVTTIFERVTGPTEVGRSTTFASWANAGYATNVFNLTFDVNTAPENFQLRQTCSATGANLNACALGFTTTPYASDAWRAMANCTTLTD